VAEPPRRGAPMTLIRGGEERGLCGHRRDGTDPRGAIPVSPRSETWSSRVRDHEEATACGTRWGGARQLHFFIAEEGITAAAYVVVSMVGDNWTLEECGDRDPPGRESVPFSRRSSHVSPSSARRSARGSLAALSLHRP
jgi:hypothetical protein